MATSTAPPPPPPSQQQSQSHPRITLPTSLLSSSPPSALDPGLRSAIIKALIAHDTIPALHAALMHECQASGWLERVRERVLELLRNGQCRSYGSLMGVVMAEAKGVEYDRVKNWEGKGDFVLGEGGGGGDGVNGGLGKGKGKRKADEEDDNDGQVNGAGAGGSKRVGMEGGIRIPDRVIREGVKIVRESLEEVVDVVVDDDEGADGGKRDL